VVAGAAVGQFDEVAQNNCQLNMNNPLNTSRSVKQRETVYGLNTATLRNLKRRDDPSQNKVSAHAKLVWGTLINKMLIFNALPVEQRTTNNQQPLNKIVAQRLHGSKRRGFVGWNLSHPAPEPAQPPLK
jgi:hypothetical protein